MAQSFKNAGYDPKEIQNLKDEAKSEGKSFVYIEDEEIDALDSGECVHVQFVGKHEGQEVICDAIIYTLRLHHGSLVYEMAVDQAKKTFPNYVAPEERQASYKIDPELEEEIELHITELIEEIEETEAVKVQEHIEVDTDFDYGIGLDVCLNTEEITDEVIETFIQNYNGQNLSLDKTLYSFSSDGQE
ncbi:hypothetical protein [Tellurirhabdus bombi]|uniref:hypothetical protein n=1 Tax=Tellurirhabdus bombi TaxID=2907205 RepID=UPI001F1FFCAE|nr:hypothetical protein [Tellurirhabdus bombi]